MSRRLATVAAVCVLLALGASVAVWAAVRGGDGDGACAQPIVTVADPSSGKMMTYRAREDCSVPGDAGG
jgi:hypothetical protein